MAFLLVECLIYILLITSVTHGDEYCPKRCTCEVVASKVKVHCGSSKDFIRSIDEIQFGTVATNIIKLNFSSNHIVNVTKLAHFPSLRKLDLSKNQISYIESGVFDSTPDLKQLDLSNNLLTTLKQNTIDALSSLKQLDISNNPLICDCDVLWISEYLQNKSVKFISNPKCTYAKQLKVQYLRKIKPGLHHQCNALTDLEETTTIKIRPNEDQIVFEGDSLQLNCFASGISSILATESKDPDANGASISWSWLNHNIDSQFTGVGIQNKYSAYGGVIDSSLHIARLTRNHTGNWRCQLTSHTVNQTKTIMVIVISNDTKYCPVTVTGNNKGVFTWPKTIVGFTVDLPCHGTVVDETVRAYYKCTKTGGWKNLNTTFCPFISETTRILEQFSKVNLTLTKVNVYDSAVHLRNYTADVSILHDTVDLVFIARTVQNYLEFLTREKELGYVLADIVNNLMQLNKVFIREADREDKTCLRLVKSMESVTEYLTVNRASFATQEFRVKRDSFMGTTCTWYTDTNRANPQLHCSSTADAWTPTVADKVMEARIQIPATIFQHLRYQDNFVVSQRMFMAMYSNSKLFPSTYKNETESYTSVVGVKLVNAVVENLTNPVYIVIRLKDGDDEITPVPVWWDPILNRGHGGWSTKGCQISHTVHDLLVFHCNQLGYYSILQKITNTDATLTNIRGARFRLSHPAVYIGGFILFSALLIAIVTYLLCYSSIQMAKKAKHSIVNTWIAAVFLCFMYTFGIYQTEDFQMCQSVGLIIHYLTLSSLLWVCVSVSNMYKRLNKTESTVLTDDLQMDPPVQKPILGLYLVGWGVALIVCGISGAVNMRDYASPSYCFLESIPALSALFVPVCILMSFIIIFLLLIRCTIRSTDGVGQLSEGTQGTENVDLDLLEPNMVAAGTASVKSSSTRSSLVEDGEHGPMTQLKAHFIGLILCTLSWLCAAISIRQPFRFHFAYEEDVFNILYALFAAAFGLFNLFFYCIARNDVRTQWTLARRWFKRKQVCFRTRSISDTNRPLPPLSTNQVSADTQITSRSSSRSSSQPKSVSRHSNNVKAAADLNSTTADEAKTQHENKSTNVDLVVLHRQQYRTNNTVPVYELAAMSSADIFYNPHQSGVARKFFRKQRRNMMKHNNLGTRRRDAGSVNSVKTIKSNSDVSSNIFGTSSKVNNKNIHVEQVKECNLKNPNILSDHYSDSEFSSRLDIPVHPLMLGSKKMRASAYPPRKNNACIENIDELHSEKDNMRTVSQQCSLEYSSETLSERVLDKDLDLDASVACSDFTDFKVDGGEGIGKVYVNPMEDILYSNTRNRDCSLRSSMSTSDVDELYAQIRQTPQQECARSRTLATVCLNDYLPTDTSVVDDNGDGEAIKDLPEKSETAF